MKESVSKEDMAAMANAKNKLDMVTLQAEKAEAMRMVADLEYKATVQHIFIKYRLNFDDTINDLDGTIIRQVKEEPKGESNE